MKINNLTITNGWIKSAKIVRSPNFNTRPTDTTISLLVIHNISLPPNQYGSTDICDFFCNQLDISKHPFYLEIEGLTVSAHLLIRRDGSLIQFVSFNDRAWHAGQSNYQGRENCNDFSIGIELEGDDQTAFCCAQYQTLTQVTQSLIINYPNIANNITGHEHISPSRKTDPGPQFDWKHYLQSIK